MPYVRCSTCGMTTYLVSAADCPTCESPMQARAGAPAGPEPRSEIRATASFVRRALALAREGLEADVAFLSEISDGREIVRATSVGSTMPDIRRGVSAPLEDTICQKMLEGRIERLVRDVAAEPALADLEIPQDSPIGAYIGVPLTGADARVFVLCCLAREARPDLGEGDLRFLEGVAASLRAGLDDDPFAVG